MNEISIVGRLQQGLSDLDKRLSEDVEWREIVLGLRDEGTVVSLKKQIDDILSPVNERGNDVRKLLSSKPAALHRLDGLIGEICARLPLHSTLHESFCAARAKFLSLQWSTKGISVHQALQSFEAVQRALNKRETYVPVERRTTHLIAPHSWKWYAVEKALMKYQHLLGQIASQPADLQDVKRLENLNFFQLGKDIVSIGEVFEVLGPAVEVMKGSLISYRQYHESCSRPLLTRVLAAVERAQVFIERNGSSRYTEYATLYAYFPFLPYVWKQLGKETKVLLRDLKKKAAAHLSNPWNLKMVSLSDEIISINQVINETLKSIPTKSHREIERKAKESFHRLAWMIGKQVPGKPLGIVCPNDKIVLFVKRNEERLVRIVKSPLFTELLPEFSGVPLVHYSLWLIGTCVHGGKTDALKEAWMTVGNLPQLIISLADIEIEDIRIGDVLLQLLARLFTEGVSDVFRSRQPFLLHTPLPDFLQAEPAVNQTALCRKGESIVVRDVKGQELAVLKSVDSIGAILSTRVRHVLEDFRVLKSAWSAEVFDPATMRNIKEFMTLIEERVHESVAFIHSLLNKMEGSEDSFELLFARAVRGSCDPTHSVLAFLSARSSAIEKHHLFFTLAVALYHRWGGNTKKETLAVCERLNGWGLNKCYPDQIPYICEPFMRELHMVFHHFRFEAYKCSLAVGQNDGDYELHLLMICREYRKKLVIKEIVSTFETGLLHWTPKNQHSLDDGDIAEMLKTGNMLYGEMKRLLSLNGDEQLQKLLAGINGEADLEPLKTKLAQENREEIHLLTMRTMEGIKSSLRRINEFLQDRIGGKQPYVLYLSYLHLAMNLLDGEYCFPTTYKEQIKEIHALKKELDRAISGHAYIVFFNTAHDDTTRKMLLWVAKILKSGSVKRIQCNLTCLAKQQLIKDTLMAIGDKEVDFEGLQDLAERVVKQVAELFMDPIDHLLFPPVSDEVVKLRKGIATLTIKGLEAVHRFLTIGNWHFRNYKKIFLLARCGIYLSAFNSEIALSLATIRGLFLLPPSSSLSSKVRSGEARQIYELLLRLIVNDTRSEDTCLAAIDESKDLSPRTNETEDGWEIVGRLPAPSQPIPIPQPSYSMRSSLLSSTMSWLGLSSSASK